MPVGVNCWWNSSESWEDGKSEVVGGGGGIWTLSTCTGHASTMFCRAEGRFWFFLDFLG